MRATFAEGRAEDDNAWWFPADARRSIFAWTTRCWRCPATLLWRAGVADTMPPGAGHADW